MVDPHPLHGMLRVAALGEPWHDFYLLAGTAAVTLVGLLFVSLSLHVEILFRPRHADFREMAGLAFQGYLYVLVSALVFLVPVATPEWQLWVFGFLNVFMLLRALWRVPAYLRARRARGGGAHHGRRFVLLILAYALGLVAAVQGLGGEPSAAFTLLAPVILMLSTATRAAWDLLAYVGQARAQGET